MERGLDFGGDTKLEKSARISVLSSFCIKPGQSKTWDENSPKDISIL